jgi:hypothetical protein
VANLSDEDEQSLAAAVCQRVTGMTADRWRHLDLTQRLPWLREAAAHAIAETKLQADPPTEVLKPVIEPPNATPIKLLAGWREITDALGRPYADRKKIRSLNSRCGGPIKNRGIGTQPWVDRDDLIKWWNRLAEMADVAEDRRADAQASAGIQHNFGRDGTVAPEIGGEVKKRRQRKPA